MVNTSGSRTREGVQICWQSLLSALVEQYVSLPKLHVCLSPASRRIRKTIRTDPQKPSNTCTPYKSTPTLMHSWKDLSFPTLVVLCKWFGSTWLEACNALLVDSLFALSYINIWGIEQQSTSLINLFWNIVEVASAYVVVRWLSVSIDG